MILGPTLFNIDLEDMFLLCEYVPMISLADDKSPYSCEKDIESVMIKLQNDSLNLLDWFKNNGLRANPDEFRLILSEHDDKTR